MSCPNYKPSCAANQGRNCACSLASTRMALGLHRIAFLNQDEGGKSISDGIPTPEEMQEKTHSVAWTLGWFVLAAFIAWIVFGVVPQLPFSPL